MKRQIRVTLVGVLLLILALTGGMSPAAAQGSEDAIEALALRAHLQNLRTHSYTFWIGGDLGDPQNSSLKLPPLGEKLVGWQLQGLGGDPVASATELERPVLLNFWASWCPPCRLEFPHLVDVALASGDHAFDVLFVNMADAPGDALAFLSGFPDGIHVVIDEGDKLAERVGIESIPTSLLLDRDGTLLAVHMGMMTPTITAFLDAVAAQPGVGLFVAADHPNPVLQADLLPLDEVENRPLSPGEPVSGTLSDDDFQHVYRFEGHAGDVVKARLVAALGSELDTYLVIMALDGERLGENDDADDYGTDSELEVILPADGLYAVVATRFLEAEGYAGGDYTLTVTIDPATQAAPGAQPPTPTPAAGAPTLAYGMTVSGTLTDQHYEDRWTFEGQQGEVISLVMGSALAMPGGLDGYLILIGPDGAPLAEMDDSAGGVMPAIENYELTQTGLYTAVATRFGGADGFSTGDYTLSLDKVSDISQTAPQAGITQWFDSSRSLPGARWIAYNETVRGAVSDEQVDAWYIFRGAAGDVVTVRMAGLDALDPYLILVDADGFELASNDDAADAPAQAAIVDYVLPAAGTYLIRATRYGFQNGPSAGEYTLVIETTAESLPSAGDSQAIELTVGRVVDGTLAAEHVSDQYAFNGWTGEVITIGVRRAAGDLNPALSLRGPDLREIAFNRDWFSPDEARIARLALPQDGVYTLDVILEDLSTAGDYRLILLTGTAPELPPVSVTPSPSADLEFVLAWPSAADLDLVVAAPSETGASQSGCCAHDFCAEQVTEPVERAAWPGEVAGETVAGLYSARVLFVLDCAGRGGPVPFTLTVIQAGQVVDVIEGELAREGDSYQTVFEYRP